MEIKLTQSKNSPYSLKLEIMLFPNEKVKKEMQTLKEEYKQCMEALKEETYDKNKAEALYKAIKDKIDTEKNENEETTEKTSDKEEHNSEEEMSVDEENKEEDWEEQRKKKKTKASMVQTQCDKCKRIFKSISDLKEHNVEKHSDKQNKIFLKCTKCDAKLRTEEELKKHCGIAHLLDKAREVCSECTKCDAAFNTGEELGEHLRLAHGNEDMVAEKKCLKCDKVYSTISKLRRHDWRCHREIECNNCVEIIGSRQDLKKHRELQHQMFRKVSCRFFPNCMDEDECLYEHEGTNTEEYNNGKSFCLNGSNCDDQSCRFSEQSHLKDRVLCRFQSRCNRLNCSYKHTVARKAFLEEGQLGNKRK